MRHHSLLVLLGLLAGSEAQLLKHLPKLNRLDPAKIANQRPDDLAKAAEAAKDAATQGAATVVDQAQQATSSGDLAQKVESATESATHQASTAQDTVKDSLDKASNVLDHMSEHVGDLDPADVEKTKVSGDSTLSDLAGAVKHQSKEEVAGAIRDATPKVTEVLDRTGMDMADQIIKGTPKAVSLVNRTSDQMAEALHPVSRPADHAVPFEESLGDRGFSSLAGILLVAATAAGGYFVAQHFKTSSTRSPVLLSEALDGVNSRGISQGRGGAVQLSTVEEPGFSRF